MIGRWCIAVLLAVAAAQVIRPVASSYEVQDGLWRAMPVTYCVNPANAPYFEGGGPIISDEDFIALVKASFQKWQDLPRSHIRFNFDGRCDNDPAAPSDSVNTVGWGNAAPTQGGATRVLYGPFRYFRAGTFADITEADIVMNFAIPAITDDVESYLNVLLPRLLVHEAGHFIGLGHSKERCAVMNETFYADYLGGFCQDDIDAAAFLYP